MEKLKFKYILLSLIIMFFASCKKTSKQPFSAITVPNAGKLEELRKNVLDANSIEKTFDTADGISFSTTKGTEITVHPNSFVNSNQTVVSEQIKLTAIDLYDRGTMAVANKALMAKDGLGNVLPLVTGGQIFTSINSSNPDIKVAFGNFYTVKLPTDYTGGTDPDMSAWIGAIDNDSNLVYESPDLGNHDIDLSSPSINIGTYNLHLAKFGWFNVDKFYNYQGNTTKIQVKVPTMYNKTNAGVYVTYKDEPAVLAQLATFNSSASTFMENYGFSPIGMTTYVIFISESNGKFAYAIKQFTTEINQEIEIFEYNIQEISSADLIHKINNLE